LLPADIVTTLNGQQVASADSLTQSLVSSKPGQQVTVGWLDPEGQSHSAVVTLASGPAD
jgi:S1-C subfamily serine protease